MSLANPPLEETGLFVSGEGGYHTYRIPAVVTTGRGTVLAFCEGRKKSHGDAGDIDLLLRRSADGGATWGPVQVIQDEPGDLTLGNPCPVVDPATGVVWLGFTRNNERAFVVSSADDGVTWTDRVEITEPLRAFDFPWRRIGMGPGAGLRMASGRLVLPCWLNDVKSENYRSAVVYSDDAGVSWHAGGVVPAGPDDPATLPNGHNECAIAEPEPGVLYLNARNQGALTRLRVVARSSDAGLTWSEPRFDEALVDPRNQASLLTLPPDDGGNAPRLLFCNAACADARKTLTVRISADGGQTWNAGRVVQAAGAEYSSMTPLPDGRVGCLYEHSAQRLFHVTQLRWARFPVEWVATSG